MHSRKHPSRPQRQSRRQQKRGHRPHLGKPQRKAALRDADYVVNAIQVGGFEPSTVIDFEIPKKYGLRQTIADTIGIGGIFRVLRTAPVMMAFAKASPLRTTFR